MENQANMASETCIEFDDVVAGYKDFMILNKLSFKARRGAITLLIGPNGAGKSTVLKTLFGLLQPRQGRILLDGQLVNGISPKELLARGIAFVPQGRNLFGQLSVYENLELGGITLGMQTTHERIHECWNCFPGSRNGFTPAQLALSGEQSSSWRSAAPCCCVPECCSSTSRRLACRPWWCWMYSSSCVVWPTRAPPC